VKGRFGRPIDHPRKGASLDIATLVGLLGAIAIISASILLGEGAMVFVNVPSMLIVFGGSLFVVLAKFSLPQFLGAIGVAARAFSFRLPTTEDAIKETLDLAQVARKQGVLALEEKKVSSPYFQQGLQMLVDRQDRETLQAYLSSPRSIPNPCRSSTPRAASLCMKA
jgi:chemotaxis protein MotA